MRPDARDRATLETLTRILPPHVQALALEVAALGGADDETSLLPLVTYFETVIPGYDHDEDPSPEALAAAQPDPAALEILERELRAARDRLLSSRPLGKRLLIRLGRPLLRPALAIARRFAFRGRNDTTTSS